MRIPKNITIGTKEYVEIMTMLHLYISKYGCTWVHNYVKNIPLRHRKVNGRNAGAYIVAKVCQEYKITQFDLFHSNSRNEMTEARQMLCILAAKHLGFSQVEIAGFFDKTKHFAYRSIKAMNKRIKDNHPFDKRTLARYRKLDSLIAAYMAFQPKKTRK